MTPDVPLRGRREQAAARRGLSRRPTVARAIAACTRARRSWARWAAVAALLLLTVCTYAITLVTPGFYSHDEWQKFDHVATSGFPAFAKAYGALRVGPDFGYPVRPIGFLQQGVAALWMRSAPALSHLVGVLNHALAAVLLAWVLRRAGLSRFAIGVAAVAFVASPLATVATGWVGASFDQLYVIFLLLVAGIVLRQVEDGVTLGGAAGVVLFTAAALLSKETAVAAVGAVLVLAWIAWVRAPASFAARRYAAMLGLVAAPVALYLAYRAPAIAASLTGHGVATYTPSVAHVPVNALRYFAFPFLLRDDDMSGAVPIAGLAAAAIAHGVLVAGLYRAFGMRAALAYCAGYFIFLVPVLSLPATGAHYLYGSTPAMATALALLLDAARARRIRAALVLGPFALAVLLVHALSIEAYLYDTGKCQARFLDDLDALLRRDANADAAGVEIVGEAGAPLSVGRRAVFARTRYERHGRPIVAFPQAGDADARGGRVVVRMTASCSLR